MPRVFSDPLVDVKRFGAILGAFPAEPYFLFYPRQRHTTHDVRADGRSRSRWREALVRVPVLGKS